MALRLPTSPSPLFPCALVLVVLGLTLAAPDPRRSAEFVGPERARAEADRDDLLTELRSSSAWRRRRAVERFANDERFLVVQAYAEATHDDDLEIRLAAIDALGRNQNPQALRELLQTYTNRRRNRRNDDVIPDLFRAIGRHGDPLAIQRLVAHGWEHLAYDSARARLFALGAMRSRRAVQAVLQLWQQGNPDPFRGDSRDGELAADYRVALVVLTGLDLGTDRDAWLDWWKLDGDLYRLSAELPPLPVDVARVWEAYWR